MNTLNTIAANIFDLEKDRAPLEEIAERIHSGGTLKGTNMCILILAIFIASIGLNMNSTAVIIGAMLISPLMGVIMSLGYGMATYDSAYVRESFLKLVFQVSLSVLTSAAGGASLAKAQEDLRKYKELSIRYSPAYQRFEADQKLLARIREKAPILFPSFTGVEGATIATENKDGQIIPTGFLAVITCKSPLAEDEQARLQKWLNAEAELPVSFILRITPETN